MQWNVKDTKPSQDVLVLVISQFYYDHQIRDDTSQSVYGD